MATQKLLLSFLLFSLVAEHKVVHGSSHHHHHHRQHDLQSSSPHHHHHDRQQHDLHSSTSGYPEEEPTHAFNPTKLFVFGDSYADTGNNNRWVARSWKVPYGMTFPGFPDGRFSDGLVFTDFLAKFFGVKSPLPVRWWPLNYWAHMTFGTNFAYGGTGVFNTDLTTDPNMTVQIDCFEQMIKAAVFKVAITQSSVALFTNSGNDYQTYMDKNGINVEILGFMTKVVSQLAANLKRVHALGVRKIVVAGLQPLGCLPEATAPSFQKCDDSDNILVTVHNNNLKEAVDKLNNETSPFTFVYVDLYSAFKSIIVNSTTFKHPMKPCCMGVSSEYLCGNVAPNGTKMYTVCNDPSTHFFWDTVHPTQAGWEAVYSTLGSNLDQIRI